MGQTSRERVTRCLRFEYPDRLPRELWVLPWAGTRFPQEIAVIHQQYPGDISGPAWVYRPSTRAQGDSYVIGESTDDWGCVFTSIQAGVFGEVKDPILRELADWRTVQPPYETLPENLVAARDTVNRSCAESEMFMRAPCNPRPWERMQFLRG